MKDVLYIANIRLPTEKAHGWQIVKTVESLQMEGQRVDLLIAKRHNYLSEDVFTFYELPNPFTIIRVWCLDFLATSRFKKAAFWLETFTFNLSVLWFVLRNKYAAYYTRDASVAWILSLFSKRVFYEAHTIPQTGLFWHKQVWKRSSGVVVISQGIKTVLVEQGTRAEKIVIAREGVDVENFNPPLSRAQCRTVLGVPLDQTVIIYTGHLYAWKGADLLAQSTVFLPSAAHVYIVGGTSQDVADFQKKYQHTGLHIVGWQERSRIPLWLKAADIAVLPNSAQEKISSHFTSPMKLFEYLAAGIPMVVADLPSLKEVVTAEEVIFFTPDSVESLTAAITKMLSNLPAYALKAQQLPVKARLYSWPNRAKIIISLLYNKHSV